MLPSTRNDLRTNWQLAAPHIIKHLFMRIKKQEQATRDVSPYMGGPILGAHIRMGTGLHSMEKTRKKYGHIYGILIYSHIYGHTMGVCACMHIGTDYILKLSTDGN